MGLDAGSEYIIDNGQWLTSTIIDALVLGKDPVLYNWDRKQMRSHLISCFEQQELNYFLSAVFVVHEKILRIFVFVEQ